MRNDTVLRKQNRPIRLNVTRAAQETSDGVTLSAPMPATCWPEPSPLRSAQLSGDSTALSKMSNEQTAANTDEDKKSLDRTAASKLRRNVRKVNSDLGPRHLRLNTDEEREKMLELMAENGPMTPNTAHTPSPSDQQPIFISSSTDRFLVREAQACTENGHQTHTCGLRTSTWSALSAAPLSAPLERIPEVQDSTAFGNASANMVGGPSETYGRIPSDQLQASTADANHDSTVFSDGLQAYNDASSDKMQALTPDANKSFELLGESPEAYNGTMRYQAQVSAPIATKSPDPMGPHLYSSHDLYRANSQPSTTFATTPYGTVLGASNPLEEMSAIDMRELLEAYRKIRNYERQTQSGQIWQNPTTETQASNPVTHHVALAGNDNVITPNGANTTQFSNPSVALQGSTARAQILPGSMSADLPDDSFEGIGSPGSTVPDMESRDIGIPPVWKQPPRILNEMFMPSEGVHANLNPDEFALPFEVSSSPFALPI